MLYTEDFSMRHYVGFSQIGSRIYISENIYKLLLYPLMRLITNVETMCEVTYYSTYTVRNQYSFIGI